MPQSKPAWSKIDQRLTSPPQVYGAQTLQLVAHLTGWRLTRSAEAGSFAAAWVRLQPTTLLLRRGTEEISLPITDPADSTQHALRKIALAISLICGLIIFIAGRMSKNHPITLNLKV